MKPEQIREHGASLVNRLLEGLVVAVCRVPWLVLAASLVACGWSMYVAVTRLEYHTQRNDLIDPHKDYQQRWRRYLKEFGDDDDIVVVVKGDKKPRMKAALEALAQAVNSNPDRFDRLFYKVDLRPLQSRALLFLPTEEIGRIQENLRSMNMLLEPPVVSRFDPLIGWKSLTLLQLLHEARDRAGKLPPDRPLRPEDETFLAELLAISQTATAVLEDPTAYKSPWHSLMTRKPEQEDLLSEPQYFFSGDGTLAFLLTRPVKDESSFAASQASVDSMRGIVADISAKFPDLKVGLTGLPVLEADEMTASQDDTNMASWLALGGVLLLYLVVFRSFRYPMMTVATLLVGTAWAMGLLTVTVGHLNILSATFAVMLIGMGDYGVLWVTRYEESRQLGTDKLGAMKETATSVGTGILTAALTTALAFYAAMLADFQAVAELGWIAGSGVLLCALSCFTVMPALLILTDRRPACLCSPRVFVPEQPACTPSRAAWLPAFASRPGLVIGFSAVLVAVLAVYATRVSYDHNLLHLQASDLDSVKWELTLIDHTAGASWHALSYTDTPQDALALKTRYEQLPGVLRVVEVASLVPQDQEAKCVQLRDIQHRLKYLPERGTAIPHSLPSIRHLKAELDCLIGSLQPLADASTQPLLGNLRRNLMAWRDRLGDLHPVISAERIREMEQRMAGDLADDLHRLRDVSHPAPITIADLPVPLRERYIGSSGKWLLQVFGKDSLWEYQPLAHFVDEIRTVDSEATGKPFGTLEGLRSMKHGFQWAGVYALAAIVLVLLADFRKPLRILAALAPLAMGVILTLGTMGACGFPLNPANMIAFPLILGVGVDNGVHVLHDYLSQRRQGIYTLNYTTGRGILVAALTTILGFGTLMISRHRGLFSLGFILTLGVTCCMLSALVFLPAVLRLFSIRDEMQRNERESREETMANRAPRPPRERPEAA
jgi:hopanoid biosynthesis associated RND transporter like protein HpnN